MVRFDYAGALELAAALVDLGANAESAHGLRRPLRQTALDPMVFVGPYGDRHRQFADLEDVEIGPRAEACRTAADRWAMAWTRAVDAFNDEAVQAARARMARYDEQRLHGWRTITALDPTTVEPPPRAGVVVAPAAAPLPTGPGFSVGPAFAHYQFDMGDLVVWPTYRDGP
ncbi:MAG: hypothetical protein AAFO29_06870 [Actinomycetota bacterium]